MIPMSQCEPGYLYVIQARNSRLGIYKGPKEGAFTISRYKFGSNYTFDEYHWDTGAPYGTVTPLKKLCKAPEFKDENEELEWLNEMAKQYAKDVLDCYCSPEEQEKIRREFCPKCSKFPCSLETECIAHSRFHFSEKKDT